MKRVDLFDPVYRVAVTFILEKDPAVFKKWLEKTCGYKFGDTMRYDNSSGYYIRLNPENHTKGADCHVVWLRYKNIPCLVHELTHLTMYIFDEKDIPIRTENSETFAYYIEHWVKRIRENW